MLNKCDAPRDFWPNDVIWAQDHKTEIGDQTQISSIWLAEMATWSLISSTYICTIRTENKKTLNITCLTNVTHHEIFGPITSSGHKIIKLRLETRLKFQASDWLKWRPGCHFSQSAVWELSLVSNLSFMILVSSRFLKNDVKAARPKISWHVTNSVRI
jgi:hypothetical protein